MLYFEDFMETIPNTCFFTSTSHSSTISMVGCQSSLHGSIECSEVARILKQLEKCLCVSMVQSN